jgi:hypothetical protein
LKKKDSFQSDFYDALYEQRNLDLDSQDNLDNLRENILI